MFKNQDGFTILEVLLATTIMSFLMLGVNSIVSSSSETKDEVTREDRAFLQVYTALNRFEIDFTQIYSPLYFTVKEQPQTASSSEDQQDSYDKPVQAYQGSEKFPSISRKGEPIGVIINESDNNIIFPTTSNRRKIQDSKESRFAWVQYKLQAAEPRADGGESRGEDLIRNFSAIDPYSKDFDWSKTANQVLLQNVKSFAIEYYDVAKEKWVGRIKELGTDQETPRLIKIKLVWMNESNNEVEFERTFRPLWPFFDTLSDEKERQAALQSKAQDSNPVGNENEE